MLCDFHKKFLVRQPLKCKIPCCIQQCMRCGRWACLGTTAVSCDISVCSSHGKDLLKGDTIVNIHADMEGPFIRSKKVSVNNENKDINADVRMQTVPLGFRVVDGTLEAMRLHSNPKFHTLITSSPPTIS